MPPETSQQSWRTTRLPAPAPSAAPSGPSAQAASTEDLIAWDQQHVLHGIIPMGFNAGFLVDHASGVSLYTSDGRSFLDGSSQLMCVELGYREEYKREVAEAVAAEIKKLPYCTNFWGFSTESVIKAAQGLSEIVPPELTRFFFTPGGGESVEIALILSRTFWKLVGSKKYKVISLFNSYHGDYWGCASATHVGGSAFSNPIAPMVPGFFSVPDYYCYRCPLGLTYPQCGIACARQIEQFILAEGPDTVAALVCEVEHGTAGCIPSPPEWLPIVRDICTRHKVHLIADEVMTGFGRTSVNGNAFACQISGVAPDFITMAKGITSAYMPLGAVAMTEEIFEQGLKGYVFSGPTYTGHPAACAAAAKVMEIYRRDKVFQHAAEMGQYLHEQLKDITADIPEVMEIAGYGMLQGIEVVKNPETKEPFPFPAMVALQETALAKGLYIRLSGGAPRYMVAPPLVSTKDEIDQMMAILRDAIKDPSWRKVGEEATAVKTQKGGVRSMGKILRVDLSRGVCAFEESPLDQAELGGHAFTSWAVEQLVPPKADALGPENVFVVAPGVLAGTAVPNSGRLSVGCKSPLTGGIKEANSGGSVARKLARLGIRGIIFSGKSPEPCILKLDTSGAKLLPAGGLWGKGTSDVLAQLRESEGGDAGIVTIGPAGEQLFKSAAVVVSTPDFMPRTAARGGVGAVMGSKNLKAIVVNDEGTSGVQVADPDLMRSAASALSECLKAAPAMGALRALGSPFLVNVANGLGCLATKNFSVGQFEQAEAISGETMAGVLASRPNSNPSHRCMAGCVVNCSQIYTDEQGEVVTSGLEYETLGLLGSNCLIADLDAIARINALADDIGIDTMELGVAVGVAMEAGKIAWGDAAAVERVVADALRGDELGALLLNGALQTGKTLGVARIPTVKGQGLAAWEPRFLKGTGTTYCTSPQGADHTAGNAIPMPTNPTYDPTNPQGQAQMSQFLQAYNAAVDTLGFCMFASLALLDDMSMFDKLADAVQAVTGQPIDHENYLVKLGMGVLAGEVAFNRAAGFTRADDRLPEFMRKEPVSPSGQVFDVAEEDLDWVFA
jgi:aldehyde:ferredoxin oxidoreductase